MCTDVTRNIIAAMVRAEVQRLVWCGGGSTIVEDDVLTDDTWLHKAPIVQYLRRGACSPSPVSRVRYALDRVRCY